MKETHYSLRIKVILKEVEDEKLKTSKPGGSVYSQFNKSLCHIYQKCIPKYSHNILLQITIDIKCSRHAYTKIYTGKIDHTRLS